MRRLMILVVMLISVNLAIAPKVVAEGLMNCNGCSCLIRIVPVGSTSTGEPIVTETPANLMIFHVGRAPVKNVWLLIVLNEQTYNALNRITINGATFMTKGDFQLVVNSMIPPSLSNSAIGYPGSECQYATAAIRDKMGEHGNPVYYGIKFFLSQITTTPTIFTLTVELNSSADPKALILALGWCGFANECSSKRFNVCSSFSNSTLVSLPEVATLALTAASLCGAAGFYIIKQRRKQK